MTLFVLITSSEIVFLYIGYCLCSSPLQYTLLLLVTVSLASGL